MAILAGASGRGQCCIIKLLHMNRLSKTEPAIFVSLMCSLLPKDLSSELILSSLQQVLCRVAAVKRLSVHHHSADYIFFRSFGIIGLILSQFENKVPLKPMLGRHGKCCFTAHEQTQ